MSSLTQPKLPFPQKKKASIMKKTKDKMAHVLSNEKTTKKIVMSEDQTLSTVTFKDLSSPRKMRSCSELPSTPKSQKIDHCVTPKSNFSHQQNQKTPSTLLNELSINSPKTPSSLLGKLKLDSPKRKIDAALEFTSPKRMLKDNSKPVSGTSVLRTRSFVRLDEKSPCGVKLFVEDDPVLLNARHDHISPSKKTVVRNQSPLKRSERLNSHLKSSLNLDQIVGTSPSKKSNTMSNSFFTKLDQQDANSHERLRSSLKTKSPAKNNSFKQSDSLNDSSLKKVSPVKIKTTSDIENELFGFDIDESPETDRYDSRLKKEDKRTPLKKNVSSVANNMSPSPRQSHNVSPSPRQSHNVSPSPRQSHNMSPSPRQSHNMSPSPRRSLRLDAAESPNMIRKFNLENSPRTTRSPLKKETDYLKPLSPIKNIILDKKSPFKPFILDDDNLTKRSPLKLFTPRKQLFQSEEEPKTEEKSKDTCELPGREVQIEGIRQFLLEHLNNEGAGSMYISGPPGTGKSASLNVILNQAEIKDAFTRIYINCNSVRNAASVYETIVTELKLKAGGKSERQQLSAIMKHFQTKHKSILLILDEIDALETRKQTILYTIFEWPSIKGSKLVLVGVANALDLTDRMLPRLQASVKLQPTLLNFAPYSKQQILDIISRKLKLTDKFNMFNASALQLLAAKVAAVSGDIRKAIDITNHLIDLTYDNVKENGEVAGIGLKEVLGVISSVYSTSQSLNCSQDQDSFPLQQKLALASLLVLKSRPNVKDVTLGKLHEVYRKVCSQRNLQPLEMSEFISAASLLDARGVIKIYGKTKNRMSKVTLQWDEQDVTEALRDKQLVSSILNDKLCL